MSYSRTTSLDEDADINAPVGSRSWAMGVLGEIKYAINRLDSDAQHVGRMIAIAREKEAWRVLGYAAFSLFCIKEIGISEDEAASLATAKPGETCREFQRRRAEELAESAKPLAGHGGDRKSEEGNQESTLSHNVDRQGTSADYLTRRIARDCPEVLERMKAGEFKSVRAAAIEAGIVKPDTPADKLRKAFSKIEADQQFPHLRTLIEQATPEARAALRVWLSECEDETP